MAIATVSVQGKVVTGDGVGVPGGKIILSLSTYSASVDDAGSQRSVAGVQQIPIALDGTVAFEIIPNAIIVPAGTRWVAKFLPNGPSAKSWLEFWNVASSPDPVDIGDIERV